MLKNSVEETLNTMLEEEAQQLGNVERYAWEVERSGYRARHYDRKFATTDVEVILRMLKLKGVVFEKAIIERYKRRETSIEEALIGNVSDRSIRVVGGRHHAGSMEYEGSLGTISNLNKKAYEYIEASQNRLLKGEYPYIYVDCIFLKRCRGEERISPYSSPLGSTVTAIVRSSVLRKD